MSCTIGVDFNPVKHIMSLTVVNCHISYNWYTTADNRNYTEIAINFIHKVRQSHNILAIAAAGPIV